MACPQVYSLALPCSKSQNLKIIQSPLWSLDHDLKEKDEKGV